jgi:hypothetical protein
MSIKFVVISHKTFVDGDDYSLADFERIFVSAWVVVSSVLKRLEAVGNDFRQWPFTGEPVSLHLMLPSVCLTDRSVQE